MVLEQLLHTVCIALENPVSQFIKRSPVAYMFYGALAAGIFEETGRLFGFKVILKNNKEKGCPVAYGIGHGGIEVVLVLGMTYFIYFLAKCGVPMGSGEAAQQLLDMANSIGAGSACLAMFERVSAVLLHIGLSMMVFVAARDKNRMWLYPLAILLHAAADAPAALLQYGLPIPIPALEIYILILAVLCVYAGKKQLNRYYTGMSDSLDAADK